MQPEWQESVKKAMEDLLFIPFEFETTGTSVIYYAAEPYIPVEGGL